MERHWTQHEVRCLASFYVVSKPNLSNVKFIAFAQCWGSVTFWCGSGSRSPHPYLWLMYLDPVSDPDPILDTTPFFSDRMQKNYCFSFFSFNLPAGTLSSVLKIIF